MSIRSNVPNLFQMQGSRSATRPTRPSILAEAVELLPFVENYINPKKARDWRRLARLDDFVMISHCMRLCDELYPGRTRGACLQRDACECELWSEVYAEGRHLWEALALMDDDAEPEYVLQKNLIQYHCLISVLSKPESGDVAWLEDTSHGPDDGDREETLEEQAEDKEEDLPVERFRFVLSCGGFPR